MIGIILIAVACFSLSQATDGQDGCLFDGKVYSAGQKFIIQPCLAEMTCLGHNNYDSKSLGGVCNDKRQADGQTGCLFDGKVYSAGDKFIIKPCLAEMTCLGNNEYDSKPLGGVCPDKRETDGQSGCWFNGKVYAAGEKFTIQPCLAEMTCLGHNNYNSKPLGGQC